MKSAPDLPRKNFTAMLRLDHNRALSQIAAKTGKPVAAIEKLAVWGNHSPTMYADYRFATIDGRVGQGHDQRPRSGTRTPSCPRWASAARPSSRRAACRRPPRPPTPPSTTCATGRWARSGAWVTMGVPSNGEYGIPKDVMFGYPVTCAGGEYKIVEGLPIDAFSRGVHRQDAGRTAGASRTASSTCCDAAASARSGRARRVRRAVAGSRTSGACAIGPREALFDDGEAARALPVCDHYCGVEARMRKSLELQAELGPGVRRHARRRGRRAGRRRARARAADGRAGELAAQPLRPRRRARAAGRPPGLRGRWSTPGRARPARGWPT